MMSSCTSILAVVFVTEIKGRLEQMVIPHEMLIERWIGCRTGEVDLESVGQIV